MLLATLSVIMLIFTMMAVYLNLLERLVILITLHDIDNKI